jgi:isopenicillin-N epimerase
MISVSAARAARHQILFGGCSPKQIPSARGAELELGGIGKLRRKPRDFRTLRFPYLAHMDSQAHLPSSPEVGFLWRETPPSELPGVDPSWFPLDRSYAFLNHGSFGSCPLEILAAQRRWRDEIEARPIEMLGRRLTPLLREAAGVVARFVGTAPERLGFVTNATEAINAVLRSIDWKRGDEVVVVDHVYGAMRQSIRRLGDESGVVLREVEVPLPVAAPAAWIDAVVGAFGDRTRLLLVDHVTSPTALVLPVAAIVRAARERGIFTLVDGAHAPGSIDLDVDGIGADAYAANLHKWCCAPKGSGFLAVRAGLEGRLHALATSHDYGRGFTAEHDWQGTRDPSAWLATPAALSFFERLGWPAVRRRNHAMAAWAQRALCSRWDVEPMSPPDGSMLAAMAAVRLPREAERRFESVVAFQSALYDRHRVEIPVIDWKGRWHVRVSCHLHTTPEAVARLDEGVRALLERG